MKSWSRMFAVNLHSVYVCLLVQGNRTLKKRRILVTNMARAMHFRAPYIALEVFIQVCTDAQNVASVSTKDTHLKYTCGVIPDRNHSNVLFATNSLQHQVNLLSTAEFTVETNHTSVSCVTRHLVCLEALTDTWESIQETNHTNVTCVTKHLVCLDI